MCLPDDSKDRTAALGSVAGNEAPSHSQQTHYVALHRTHTS